jgi:phospholipid-binding lipoprotein MlaA
VILKTLPNNIPGGLNNIQPFFDQVFEAFAKVYQEGASVNFSSGFLYAAYKDQQPDDSSLAALVGLSFRQSSANMIFTSDVFTNSGYIKPKNLELSTSDSVTDYFKVANRVSFEDYFEELFAPYFKRRYPSMTKSALIESLGVKGIEEYLRQTKKIGLVHNADDVILGPDDLGYFQDVFGARAKIFPRGGHCGNIDHKDFVAYMLAFFGKGTISLSDEVDSLQASNPGPNLSDGVGNVLLVSNEPSKDFRSSRFNFDRLAQEDSLQKPLPRSPHTRFEPDAKGSKRYWDSSGNGFSDSPMVLAQSMPRVSSGQAIREVSAIVREDVQYPIDVYDPMEGFNRRVYKFNAQFDEYVFLPVVRGYETVMPDYVEDRISNFFNNVLDIRNLINSALQLKGQTTLTTGGRFLINTILGIGGLWDHATGWGLPRQPEDFGQTLGHYGVGNGPFLVLPIFGPSNVRDTAGFGVDLAARYFYLSVPLGLDDSTAGSWAYGLSNSIDTRHQLHFRYYQTGSPFEYDLVRLLYTKKRELDIGK